jgi:hypothetical protein
MPEDRASVPRPNPEASAVLLSLIHGYAPAQLIYVAAKLGVADRLSAGPLSAAGLAAAVGAPPETFIRILRGLVHCGVLTEGEDGRFALSALGACLQTHVPGSLRGLAIIHGEAFYPAWGALLDATRDNAIAFEQVFGHSFFEHLRENPALDQIFNNFLIGLARQTAGLISEAYDFSAARTLVDVGGAYGSMLAPILAAHPHLRGVLFDTAPVLEGADLFFEAAGLGDRTEIIAGDFFEAVPPGDCYLISQVLHDWDDERSGAILANCRRAATGAARVLVVEMVLPERIVGHAPAVHFDVNMLVLNSGRERTPAEFGRLFAAGGWELARVLPLRSPFSIVEGRAAPAG